MMQKKYRSQPGVVFVGGWQSTLYSPRRQKFEKVVFYPTGYNSITRNFTNAIYQASKLIKILNIMYMYMYDFRASPAYVCLRREVFIIIAVV